MASPSQTPSSQTLNEFLDLLEKEWTLPVACQDQCHPPETCSCLRHIVHVEALRAWWMRTTSDTAGYTRLKRILDDLEPADHQLFPVEQKWLSGDYSCLTVFSLLLEQGRHYLINAFHDAGMNDKNLEYETQNSDSSLRRSLAKVANRGDVDRILEDFQRERWAYCPLKLEMHMDRYLQSTRIIPPFCRKIKLGEKGGTASIYWVTVQEMLVTDDSLKNAIQDSAYHDEDFGKCYQMVLKTYSGKHESAYDSEKKAFSGLKLNESVPIVGYLGCYTHEYGEGPDAGKTYNLLLEWGERDLYEAWEDEKNVPPVRAEEIILFWKSLFEIADAIRHIHNLEVRRVKGRSLMFNGWHADIKPDNILSVRGRLKLADFGFSQFSPAVRSRNDSVPTNFIEGFTDTYGAPEVSRKVPNGTLSGVTQSIDIWSFGCVLSVAATWIVLGFTGVRQFEELRQLLPANRIGDKTYDRFHDGFDVLPEIKKWHNFLRGHIRSSDTATTKVLDLVELKMLQADTRNRIHTDDLCIEFESLLESATTAISKLRTNSKDTDDIVLRALLNVEQVAQTQRSSEQTINPLQQRLNTTADVAPLDPRQRASLQIHKEERRKSRLLGQTPFRREILERELRSRSSTITEENDTSNKDLHSGDTTESPIQETSFDNAYPPLGISNGVTRGSGGASVHYDPADDQNLRSPHTSSTSPLRSKYVSRSPVDVSHEIGRARLFDSDHTEIPNNSGNQMRSLQSAGRENGAHTKPTHYATDPSRSQKHMELSVLDPSGPSSALASVSRSDDPSKRGIQAADLSQIANSQTHYGASNDFSQYDHHADTHGFGSGSVSRDVLLVQTPMPNHQTRGARYDPPNQIESVHEMPLKSSPDIGDTKHSIPNPTSPLTNTPLRGLRILGDPALSVYSQYGHVTPTNCEKIPFDVYDLPYDICRQRKILERETPKGVRARLKGKFGLEVRKPDSDLAPIFSVARDLVLVIDNGATMFRHFPIATFVAETLARKAAGLDRDGIDVFFTVDGDVHNRKALVGDSGRQQLQAALVEATPDNNDHDDHKESQTDMLETFRRIAEGWRIKGKPATTLLVLTDGLWKDTNKNEFDKAIIKVAQDATQVTSRRTGNRSFSIQFIRFGDEGYERLRELDDVLCSRNMVRDIVDHCSWRTSVDKMIKGSIEGFHDQDDNDEKDMMYHYQDLVALFKSYNDLHHVQEHSSTLLSPLSPSPSLARTFSLVSNSSNREKHRSTPEPLPRRGSSHRKMFSQ
ncbi:hypothetical protein AA0112_g9043 [Alternaria arborescens]|nr:hypothetical protein AA0112_g9043 [Alternaria arborescens]